MTTFFSSFDDSSYAAGGEPSARTNRDVLCQKSSIIMFNVEDSVAIDEPLVVGVVVLIVQHLRLAVMTCICVDNKYWK